jgi:hypothetical protein
VLLVLASLYVVRFLPLAARRALAALVFALAFLTKQSASLLFVPLALHVALSIEERPGSSSGGGLALMIGSVALLDWIHEGWFWYFVFWLPRQHPLVGRMVHDFWVLDLLAPLGIACLFGLFYLLVGDGDAEARRFHALAAPACSPSPGQAGSTRAAGPT